MRRCDVASSIRAASSNHTVDVLRSKRLVASNQHWGGCLFAHAAVYSEMCGSDIVRLINVQMAFIPRNDNSGSINLGCGNGRYVCLKCNQIIKMFRLIESVVFSVFSWLLTVVACVSAANVASWLTSAKESMLKTE